jgi:hypothetical protein
MCSPRLALLGLVLGLAGLLPLAGRPRVPLLTGQVRDERGPVASARVRIQGRPIETRTDAEGRFALPYPGESIRVTAAKGGYFIAGAPTLSPLVLTLQRLPAADSERYEWVDPTPDPARRHNCGNCHGAVYREWAASGHARAATGRHFRNLYDGTDWHGNPGRGWNLLAEYPDGAAVCTACHAPGLTSFADPAYSDLRLVRGSAAHGVHCDFCHKVAAVDNEQIGLTHGRFGLKLLRPAEGQLFFGPLDDVDRGDDAFAPVYRQSRYCASCHEGTVFGVAVYSTYSEWLASPARQQGKECQTCHMAPTGRLTNLAPGKGGLRRDPATLANHRFFAGDREAMLRRALHLRLQLSADGEAIRARVELHALDVGHRLPTGFVDHHLLLVVEPLAADGRRLAARGGDVLPARAGAALAGVPGRLYAKQLVDFEGRGPVPFWRAAPEALDTRLVPGVADRAEFLFPAETDRVRVRLLERRFWQEVADAKGWPDNETVLLDRTLRAANAATLAWPDR